MLTVFLRTLCIYIMLTGVMRLMGKRQIGELQLSELICALLLSEIATAPISDPRIPLIRSIVPIAGDHHNLYCDAQLLLQKAV